MPTLLLTLAGPLQAWGTHEGGHLRDTDTAPSKSGVVGMIAAALGRSRFDSLSDLTTLAFGVRIDLSGTRITDMHTTQTTKQPEGGLAELALFGGRKPATSVGEVAAMSWRTYLADAVFVAAVSGDTAPLEKYATALRHPVYPLFLGRRACPAEPVDATVVEDSTPVEALRSYPFQGLAPIRRTVTGDDGTVIHQLRDGSWGIPKTLEIQHDCMFGDDGAQMRNDMHAFRKGWAREFHPRPFTTVLVPAVTPGDVTFDGTYDDPIGF